LVCSSFCWGYAPFAEFTLERSEGLSDPGSTRDLAGLWQARQRFGPDIRGPLLLQRQVDYWLAELGRRALARWCGDTITFELPDSLGSFRGRLHQNERRIKGHWSQQVTLNAGARFASPVSVSLLPTGILKGDVDPLDDAFTFYLNVDPWRRNRQHHPGRRAGSIP
jgi:hypothetical protein